MKVYTSYAFYVEKYGGVEIKEDDFCATVVVRKA